MEKQTVYHFENKYLSNAVSGKPAMITVFVAAKKKRERLGVSPLDGEPPKGAVEIGFTREKA